MVFKRALTKLQTSTTILSNAGFQRLAFEDFYEIACNLFAQLRTISTGELLSAFQLTETSDAIVVYFRFLTSAFLKLHEDEFAPFLSDMNDYTGIEHFCAHFVDAFGREADQVQIIALVRALGVGINIAYLDNSEGDVTVHSFDADEGALVKTTDGLCLLYRPGHYDILYK